MCAKQKKALDIFWRTYFWITIILWIFLIEAVITGKKFLPEAYTIYFKLIGAGVSFFATIALFGYVYKKNIFTPFVWILFFYIFLFWEIYSMVFLMYPEKGIDTIGLILSIPLYISIFLYAFKFKR